MFGESRWTLGGDSATADFQIILRIMQAHLYMLICKRSSLISWEMHKVPMLCIGYALITEFQQFYKPIRFNLLNCFISINVVKWIGLPLLIRNPIKQASDM